MSCISASVKSNGAIRLCVRSPLIAGSIDGRRAGRRERLAGVRRHAGAVLCENDVARDPGDRDRRAERCRSIAAAVDSGKGWRIELRTAEQQRGRNRGGDIAADPHDLIDFLNRREPGGRRRGEQRRQRRVGRAVDGIIEERIGDAARRVAGRPAHETREPETVAQLVEQHDDEIVLHAVVIVETEIEIEVAAELRHDLRCRAGEAERIEARLDLDIDVAVERRAPHVGGELKGDQPLLALVVPGLPPTGAAGVGSLNPSFGPSTLTTVMCALAKAGAGNATTAAANTRGRRRRVDTAVKMVMALLLSARFWLL